MKNLKIRNKKISQILLPGLVLLTISGCGKKSECDIEYDHAHLYKTSKGYVTYRDSEEMKIDCAETLFWTSETCALTKEIIEMEQYDLFKIEDNLEILEMTRKNDTPYLEYEEEGVSGKISYHDTESESMRLTGNVRDVSTKYIGYQIITLDQGNRRVLASDLVDNLETIKEEYPYFDLHETKQLVYSKPYYNEKK